MRRAAIVGATLATLGAAAVAFMLLGQHPWSSREPSPPESLPGSLQPEVDDHSDAGSAQSKPPTDGSSAERTEAPPPANQSPQGYTVADEDVKRCKLISYRTGIPLEEIFAAIDSDADMGKLDSIVTETQPTIEKAYRRMLDDKNRVVKLLMAAGKYEILPATGVITSKNDAKPAFPEQIVQKVVVVENGQMERRAIRVNPGDDAVFDAMRQAYEGAKDLQRRQLFEALRTLGWGGPLPPPGSRK